MSERISQHLHLTMGGTHLRTMSERHAHHLHLTMGGRHPKPISEWPNTHIQPHLVRKALHLHLTSSCKKGSALTSDLIMLERHCTYIQPHYVRKALHLHPTSSCQKGQWAHQFPLEGISIWRTPSFSLEYSKFTLANGLVSTSALCFSVLT